MSRILKRKDQTSAMPLPEIGRIKVGIKHPEKGYPMSLDYFRPSGQFSEMFTKQFGEKPTKLLLVFISDDINQSCVEQFEAWDKGKRQGWGNGETFTVWDPSAGKDGDYVEVDKDSKLLAGKDWKETVTLRFLLPELRGVLGYWQFQTKGSKSSIPGLVQAFDFIQSRMGTVVGVPFELIVEKVKGYSPGAARQYSRVKLVANISESYMLKVREELAAGRSMEEIAPLMVSEAKLLSEGEKKVFELEAPVEEVEHEEVKGAPKTTASSSPRLTPNINLFEQDKP
jgi:hypothetical protein